MSINLVRGASAYLSAAATSLAFPNSAQGAGDLDVIAVAILDTTVSVSSISDGTNIGTLVTAQNNGTSVRVELWTLPIASGANRIITINFTGATLASAAYEEYSGSTGVGNIGLAAFGTSNYPSCSTTSQDTGSFVVAALAIASSSGDSVNGIVGGIRQGVIPALTTAGVVLMDITSVEPTTLPESLYISSSRAWAAASLELRTGVAATTITASSAVGPNIRSAQNYQVVKAPALSSGSTPVPVAQVLQSAIVGTAYSETISVQGGASPYTFSVLIGALPTGTALNTSTGVISGTPSVAGTYDFTIKVTDAAGAAGQAPFRITVALPVSGNFGYSG